MDNQDKIINKIKAAAQQAEHQDFPGMEKIWARVDEKLDQRALQTKNKVWKKIAIAASVLLLVSLGYQLLKPAEANQKTNEILVQKDSVHPIAPKTTEKAVATTVIDTAKINSVIKETLTPSKEIKDKITAPAAVALQEVQMKSDDKTAGAEKMMLKKERVNKSKSNFNSGAIYDAIEVQSAYATKTTQDPATETKPIAANAPLVVKNGKIISSAKYKTMQETKKEIVSDLDNEELESLIILKEPLYIINGIEYSEASLFGPNPTSPYAPLSKQKIVTLEILQNDEATAKYGDKGKKGVVIVTTKNGIPLQH
jgi:negative regulator of sigma E activity